MTKAAVARPTFTTASALVARRGTTVRILP